MTEIKTPVKTILVNRSCDSCKEGKMLQYGTISYMTYPPKFPHKCDVCGAVETLQGIWPRVEYIEDKDND